MDVNFGVSVLRLHNQYVIQLATELSTTLQRTGAGIQGAE